MANNGISLRGKDGSEVVGEKSSTGIKVQAMQFSYESDSPLFLEFNLEIGSGSRCLLVGANGSGTPIMSIFSLYFSLEDVKYENVKIFASPSVF